MNYNISSINPNLLSNYLLNLGWINISNSKKYLFRSPNNILDGNLELSFSMLQSDIHWKNLLPMNLETLAKLYDKNIEEIIKAIKDISGIALNALINKNLKMDSIPLPLARNTINSVYNLLLYGYSSEYEPVEYCLNPNKKAHLEVSRLKFPHTFNGSFGLSVNLEKEEIPLFDEQEFTMEERVLARIFSGFDSLKSAIINKNENIIADNYENGFNANMCDALSKIAKKMGNNTITFDAYINRKKKHIIKINPYVLREDNYEILNNASEKLRARSPIQNVELLCSAFTFIDKNRVTVFPLPNNNYQRKVVVTAIINTSKAEVSKVLNKKSNRHEVTLILNEAFYELALNAYQERKTISVIGDLYIKSGNKLELSNIKNIKNLDA